VVKNTFRIGGGGGGGGGVLTSKILTSTAANDQHRQGFQPQEILTSKSLSMLFQLFWGGPGGLSMLFLIAYENVKKTEE
jgi:hypothetical protein